jgi:predicted HicB family RNase H-like nuclease
MKDRNKEIFAVRMPVDLKDHIKATAFSNGDSTNGWVVEKLIKASKYKKK